MPAISPQSSGADFGDPKHNTRTQHIGSVVTVIIVAAALIFVCIVSTKLPDNKDAAPASQGQGQAHFPAGKEPSTVLTSASPSTARQELASLPSVDKYSDAIPKYEREKQFGPAWSDKLAAGVEYGGNGCSTRNDILARDMINVTKDKDGCKVLSGQLYDPYNDRVIPFTYGKATSSAVQIDHIVALEDVWRSGGYKLPFETRAHIANDPINLIAVDGPTNGAKGSRDISQWTPPNKKILCHYAAAQIRVKARYGLGVSDQRPVGPTKDGTTSMMSERQALAAALDTCTGHADV